MKILHLQIQCVLIYEGHVCYIFTSQLSKAEMSKRESLKTPSCKMCFHFKFDITKQCVWYTLSQKTLNRFKSRSMKLTCTHLKWDACNLFMCFCSEIEYSNVRHRRDGRKGNGVTEYQSSPPKITSTKLQIFQCCVLATAIPCAMIFESNLSEGS